MRIPVHVRGAFTWENAVANLIWGGIYSFLYLVASVVIHALTGLSWPWLAVLGVGIVGLAFCLTLIRRKGTRGGVGRATQPPGIDAKAELRKQLSKFIIEGEHLRPNQAQSLRTYVPNVLHRAILLGRVMPFVANRWTNKVWLFLVDNAPEHSGLYTHALLPSNASEGAVDTFGRDRVAELRNILNKLTVEPVAAGYPKATKGSVRPEAAEAVAASPAGEAPAHRTTYKFKGRGVVELACDEIPPALFAPSSVRCEVTDPTGLVSTTKVAARVTGPFATAQLLTAERTATVDFPTEFDGAQPLVPGVYRVRWLIPRLGGASLEFLLGPEVAYHTFRIQPLAAAASS